MKSLLISVMLGLILTSTAMASGGHGRGHAYGHYKHRQFRPNYPPVGYGYPQAPRYQPGPGYGPVPNNYRNYPGRGSTEGMLGGVLGSAVGYELGGGNPVATGIGAAAGSLLGNEIRR